MRTSGMARRAASRRSAQMSASATILSGARFPSAAYAGRCPRSAMKPCPMIAPRSAGAVVPGAKPWRLSFVCSVIVLVPEVRDHLFAHHPAEGVLQLHELNEEVVLRIEPFGVHGALEVEGKPLLRPL